MIGYDQDSSDFQNCGDSSVIDDNRTGSHNLIIGDCNQFTASGGLVAGFRNQVSGAFASVSAGLNNKAGGDFSDVSGGAANLASGKGSSVGGGSANEASGIASSVLGGHDVTVNTTNGTSP